MPGRHICGNSDREPHFKLLESASILLMSVLAWGWEHGMCHAIRRTVFCPLPPPPPHHTTPPVMLVLTWKTWLGGHACIVHIQAHNSSARQYFCNVSLQNIAMCCLQVVLSSEIFTWDQQSPLSTLIKQIKASSGCRAISPLIPLLILPRRGNCLLLPHSSKKGPDGKSPFRGVGTCSDVHIWQAHHVL